ncbi:MAG: type IX secretion system PorP/SprF family membrane protein [Crocinitomix sp.]|jgi:type IX secretion system PorP/SprF family membrane protein
MKSTLTILLAIFLLNVNSFAQNRISYSQYMHNQGVFNPAYFSLENRLTATMYYKKQWVGIEGAPVTKSLVAGYSINEKHLINLNIYQDAITIFKDTKFGLGYNYKIKLDKKSTLSFGIKADYGRFNSDYTTLDVQDTDDNVLLVNNVARGYFNIGTGAYFQSENLFAGIAAPFLFNNSILYKDYDIKKPSLKFNHIYFTAGGKIDFNGGVFYPTTLVKIVSGSPIQVDLNANFLIKESIWLSAGFRSDLALILSTGYVMQNGIKFIYSYDLASFTAASYSRGSHEISVGYGLAFYRKDSFLKRKFLKRRMTFKGKKTN